MAKKNANAAPVEPTEAPEVLTEDAPVKKPNPFANAKRPNKVQQAAEVAVESAPVETPVEETPQG